jgi:hypothetical protein
LGEAERALGNEKNTMLDIMRFFDVPIAEFKEFWASCNEEEKTEFKMTDLSKKS